MFYGEWAGLIGRVGGAKYVSREWVWLIVWVELKAGSLEKGRG